MKLRDGGIRYFVKRQTVVDGSILHPPVKNRWGYGVCKIAVTNVKFS